MLTTSPGTLSIKNLALDKMDGGGSKPGMAEPVLRTGSVVPNSEPVPKLEPWFPENGTGSTYFPIFIDFRLKITFKLHLRTILIMKGCTNGTTLH